MPSVRARTIWIVVVAVVALGAAAAGIRQYAQHLVPHPVSEAHRAAVADSAKKVGNVLGQFDYDHIYQAADYAHTAGQVHGVQVLSVTGRTHWQTGVTLVLKVTGDDPGDGPVCFRLQLGPERDRRDDDVPCPSGAPIPIAADPSLQGVDARLQTVLKPAGPHEPAVRAAVARLKLDPAVRQDYATGTNVVGVALRASRYDCVIARVTSKEVRLWRPSHTQLAPGELDCSAGLALTTGFGKYPH
jgi:hypothetical protein